VFLKRRSSDLPEERQFRRLRRSLVEHWSGMLDHTLQNLDDLTWECIMKLIKPFYGQQVAPYYPRRSCLMHCDV
jgi:hypothetical protein